MELEVVLDAPIEVQINGGVLGETDVLFFNAPTPAMRKERTKMIGVMFDAMLAAGKKFTGFGDKEEKMGHTDSADGLNLDGPTILSMLYAANKGEHMCDMQDIFDKVVLTPGIAFCHESKVAMNKDLWRKVDNQDYVIGEYLANFIMPALDTMTASKS